MIARMVTRNYSHDGRNGNSLRLQRHSHNEARWTYQWAQYSII